MGFLLGVSRCLPVSRADSCRHAQPSIQSWSIHMLLKKRENNPNLTNTMRVIKVITMASVCFVTCLLCLLFHILWQLKTNGCCLQNTKTSRRLLIEIQVFLVLQVRTRLGHEKKGSMHLRELSSPIVFLTNTNTFMALGVGLHATPKHCRRLRRSGGRQCFVVKWLQHSFPSAQHFQRQIILVNVVYFIQHHSSKYLLKKKNNMAKKSREQNREEAKLPKNSTEKVQINSEKITELHLCKGWLCYGQEHT